VAASSASGTAPPWEPDGNAAAPYGNITFYNASGDQVTSGTNLANPFAYAVAGTAGDSGAIKATLYFSGPQHGVVPGRWTSFSEAGPTTFSPSLSGAPADIAVLAPTYPVVASTSASIANMLAVIIPDTTPGWANTIQVRLTDSGLLGVGSPTGTYWESDIGYNTTSSPITVDGTTVPANGWAQLFPLVTPTTTTLTTSATGGNLAPGSPITLTATVSSTGTGAVQFYNNSTLLADSKTPGSGSYTYTYTPAAGSHVYTASFVPTLGDETGAYTATATIVGGSTSPAVTVADGTGTTTTTAPSGTTTTTAPAGAVRVTKFSPKRLGRGASGVGVTLTGTEFAAGAKVSAAGVRFSSVKIVNSTKITAKASVAPSAKSGAATVTVADSVGSGSCKTCLSIVAAPTVKSVVLSALVPGTSGWVTIHGTGYVSGATVVGPAGVTFSEVKVVSPTKIVAHIKVSPRAKLAKDLPVTVVNGDAGGGGRGTGKVFSIVAAPTVKSVAPSSVAPGSSKPVTITGTGYVSGATVVGPAGVTFSEVKVVSPTKITAHIKVSRRAKAGKDLPVTVVNGDAGGRGRGTGKVLTIK
jgi:hypothetical protein